MAGMELLSDQGFRTDGRKPNELRRIRFKKGVFKQADGSAYLEQGNTKVLAAVYGPHEIRGGKSKQLHDKLLINCQYSMATFSTQDRKRRPRGDRKSLEMTAHLKQTFNAVVLTDLYPKVQLDIYIEVLQSDGGNYCASVNAATLALIDAGIPMKDFVIACSGSYVRDTPIVDINNLEESGAGAEIIMAILPRCDQIVFIEMNSRLHEDYLSPVMDQVMAGCKDIFNILNQQVREELRQKTAQDKIVDSG
ncbi:exosome complex component RRP41-like [Physella acuta]|uniref:exosome complex component RRP41-like n=1 Tax=Physella acuta TaxID=109671 RepID=UPI0027DC69EB|nr:exosome complex component RRP41-like [Physella acuta]